MEKAVFLCVLVASALSAAGITLPVTEVAERPHREVSVFPGRVVPVAQVDVVPQVSGEILEVCFANGAEVKEGDVLYRLDSVRYAAAVKKQVGDGPRETRVLQGFLRFQPSERPRNREETLRSAVSGRAVKQAR